ncbi:zf-HC2 domain-containing protein [Streptomyces thermolineatus]|uniref:zf-HC2 domain-containing protein n=1 Tax=Streptomyces thermolineatus TaxID=44033 RepID=UPI00384A80FC
MSRPADPSAAHGLRRVPGPRHVHARDADAYAGGGLPEADAWRLEKHLESCGECALLVSDAVRATSVAPVLADLRAALLAAVPVAPAEERPPAAPAAEPARPAGPGRTAPARHAPRRPRPRLRLRRPVAGSARTGPAARAGRRRRPRSARCRRCGRPGPRRWPWPPWRPWSPPGWPASTGRVRCCLPWRRCSRWPGSR